LAEIENEVIFQFFSSVIKKRGNKQKPSSLEKLNHRAHHWLVAPSSEIKGCLCLLDCLNLSSGLWVGLRKNQKILNELNEHSVKTKTRSFLFVCFHFLKLHKRKLSEEEYGNQCIFSDVIQCSTIMEKF
jgi:hypothetical protein